MRRAIIMFLIACIGLFCFAEPQYASIRVKKSNIRYGPNKIYPIKFTYNIPNIPVEIVDSFEGWTHIRDIYGDTGWINSTFISQRNYSIVIEDTIAYIKNLLGKKKPKFKIEKGVIVLVKKCEEDWCQVILKKNKLWLSKKTLSHVKM